MLFQDASPGELLALANIVAIALADNLDADDLNVLGAFVTVVGDILSMLAAQVEINATSASEEKK
jgi:hypothetical protein